MFYRIILRLLVRVLLASFVFGSSAGFPPPSSLLISGGNASIFPLSMHGRNFSNALLEVLSFC